MAQPNAMTTQFLQYSPFSAVFNWFYLIFSTAVCKESATYEISQVLVIGGHQLKLNNRQKRYCEFKKCQKETFENRHFRNLHISKARLWNSGMQKSAQYWVQYRLMASIQKQLLHILWYHVVFSHLPSSFGKVISVIKAAVAHRHSFISIPVPWISSQVDSEGAVNSWRTH